MSDTIQTVRWSLGTDSHLNGQFWLPEWRESIEDVLWESIRRLGLEERIRAAFHMTAPLWYGLWISDPLTATQCSLLHDLLTEAVRIAQASASTSKTSRGLAESAKTSEPLHVELTPPGHVDFGWVTTFVHCPRCKAEGPVERWQETYPEEPLDCPVCGFSYQPALTHSSECGLFAETVRCPACQAVHRVRDFPDEVIQVLEDRHNFDASTEELGWLRRVEEFYQRHPDLEDKIKPHVLEVLESRDPGVLEAMFAGAHLTRSISPPVRLSKSRPHVTGQRPIAKSSTFCDIMLSHFKAE